MQVLFLQDVKGIARKGDVKQVKPGYFQNFLSRQKLAIVANEGLTLEAKKIQERQTVQKERIKEQAHEIQKKLSGLKLVYKAKAHDDKLYGSVGEKELIDLIQEKINVRLEKDNIRLSEHIKVAGTYEVLIVIAEGVEAKVLLEVKSGK